MPCCVCRICFYVGDRTSLRDPISPSAPSRKADLNAGIIGVQISRSDLSASNSSGISSGPACKVLHQAMAANLRNK